ncbi:MAG: hypothetical protein GF383_16405 [Candidatus Lokiarchaeota archaeon]|nr:hypothetical protein [Candidatus Lokiarchaeota archaeon]MBD3343343.1 hypothetical protein [Candidatus Lokiarchaeota archaeon]
MSSISSSTLSKTFFSYIPKNSIINKIHPLTKISLLIFLSTIIFILDYIIDILLILIFVIVLILITKVPLFSKKFLKIILTFLVANLSIFIAWCLFSYRPGKITYFQATIVFIEDRWIWNILITDQTIFYASRISLRAIIMFFLALFFFIGTTDRELIHGLRSVKVPFTICLMINLTFRGISMFQQDYQTVREAMQTRGVDFDHASIPRRIKNFVSIFIALIVLMFKRTEEMASSIEARGIPFRSKNRTIYHYYPVKKKDIIIMLLLVLFLVFSMFLRFTDATLIFYIIEIINIFKFWG